MELVEADPVTGTHKAPMASQTGKEELVMRIVCIMYHALAGALTMCAEAWHEKRS